MTRAIREAEAAKGMRAAKRRELLVDQYDGDHGVDDGYDEELDVDFADFALHLLGGFGGEDERGPGRVARELGPDHLEGRQGSTLLTI